MMLNITNQRLIKTVRQHFTPTRMAIIKIREINKSVGEDMENLNLPALIVGQNGAAALQNSMAALQKVKYRITI